MIGMNFERVEQSSAEDRATEWFERAADFTVEAMMQSYLMYSQELFKTAEGFRFLKRF